MSKQNEFYVKILEHVQHHNQRLSRRNLHKKPRALKCNTRSFFHKYVKDVKQHRGTLDLPLACFFILHEPAVGCNKGGI